MHPGFIRLPENEATRIMFNLKVEQFKTNGQPGATTNGHA